MSDSNKIIRPTDEQILAQEKAIKSEYLSAPRISVRMDFTLLYKEFEDGEQVFLNKLLFLSENCLGIRQVQRDGNCFYRAFAFRLCELLLENKDTKWTEFMHANCIQTKSLLTEMGYDMELLIDFYDMFEQAINAKSLEELHELFNTEFVSDTIICYMRLVTAAILKRDSFMYESFVLDSFPSIQDFIATQVEPMNIESDQIHIVTMSNAFDIDVKIANLDRSQNTNSSIHYLDISPMTSNAPSNAPQIHLLYRPGHYDVLYPK